LGATAPIALLAYQSVPGELSSGYPLVFFDLSHTSIAALALRLLARKAAENAVLAYKPTKLVNVDFRKLVNVDFSVSFPRKSEISECGEFSLAILVDWQSVSGHEPAHPVTIRQFLFVRSLIAGDETFRKKAA